MIIRVSIKWLLTLIKYLCLVFVTSVAVGVIAKFLCGLEYDDQSFTIQWVLPIVLVGVSDYLRRRHNRQRKHAIGDIESAHGKTPE